MRDIARSGAPPILCDSRHHGQMDIRLTTNNATGALELRSLQRFGTKAGLVTFLVVRSGAFAAALPFYFERARLSDFIRELQMIDRTRSGTATLKSSAEPGCITFEVDGSGHLRVFGILIDAEEHEQRMEFSFGTDQGCLGQLVTDLAAFEKAHP